MGRGEKRKQLEEMLQSAGVDWSKVSFHYTETPTKGKNKQNRYKTRVTENDTNVLVLFVAPLKIYLLWNLRINRKSDYSVIAADVERYVISGYVEKNTGFLNNPRETVYVADENNVCDKVKSILK